MPTLKLSELEELINHEDNDKFRNRSKKEKRIDKERKKQFKKHLDKE